jgi:hypothetical protein
MKLAIINEPNGLGYLFARKAVFKQALSGPKSGDWVDDWAAQSLAWAPAHAARHGPPTHPDCGPT